MKSGPRSLKECHSIADLRLLAERRLPSPVFHFADGGAEDEVTLQANSSDYRQIGIRPRVLVDVSNVDTSTTMLGQRVAMPLMCSPTGGTRIFHRDGELAVAAAADEAGLIYSLSCNATTALAEVSARTSGPKMYQLYIYKDRELTWELVDKCRAAGYSALCVTVDTPELGKRERDLRLGWGVPIRLSPTMIARLVARPRWLTGLASIGGLTMPDFGERVGTRSLVEQSRYVASQFERAMSWDDVAVLRDRWKGPLVLKGILHPEDAIRAADHGVDAVMLSNHGGRQLDGALSPIRALPAIRDAVGDRMELIADGGVRRGSDILKAVALGATGCSIGRPYLYGVAAGGRAGVQRCLQILQGEFTSAMRLTGCRSVAEIGSSILG